MNLESGPRFAVICWPLFEPYAADRDGVSATGVCVESVSWFDKVFLLLSDQYGNPELLGPTLDRSATTAGCSFFL